MMCGDVCVAAEAAQQLCIKLVYTKSVPSVDKLLHSQMMSTWWVVVKWQNNKHVFNNLLSILTRLFDEIEHIGVAALCYTYTVSQKSSHLCILCNFVKS